MTDARPVFYESGSIKVLGQEVRHFTQLGGAVRGGTPSMNADFVLVDGKSASDRLVERGWKQMRDGKIEGDSP